MSREVNFFISRSGTDAPIARAIASILVDEGHTVILQDWDFGHADFVAKMDDAIERAHRTITLLSPAYLKSEFCGAEWRAIFARDPRNFEQELILLRVEHCQPTGLLCLLAYTDLVPVLHDADLLREVLLARVKYKAGPERNSLLASYTRSSTPILHRSLRSFPHLVGRDADIQRIDDTLRTGQPVVIVGLGGVGKSALAHTYGLRCKEEYAGVWWITAADDKEIMRGFIELGSLFVDGLQGATNPQRAVAATLEILRQFDTRPWLLIFDDVRDGDDLRPYLNLAGARILATTRIEGWESAVARVDIGQLTAKDAVSFMRNESGRRDGKDADWEALAKAVGTLPLALSHIATYLRRAKVVTPARCLQRVRALMAGSPSLKDPKASVDVTYRLAIERVDAEAPGASLLMGFLSFFEGSAMPLEVLEGPPEIYPEVLRATLSDPNMRDEAVSAVVNASLADIDLVNNTLRLHVLVAQAALPSEYQGEWYAAVRQALYHPLMYARTSSGNTVGSKITGKETFEELTRYIVPGLTLDLAAPKYGVLPELHALGVYQTWDVVRLTDEEWAFSVATRSEENSKLLAPGCGRVQDYIKKKRTLAFDFVRRGDRAGAVAVQLELCREIHQRVGVDGVTSADLVRELSNYGGMAADAGEKSWVIEANFSEMGYRVQPAFKVADLMNGIGIVESAFGLPQDEVMRTMSELAETSPPDPAAFLNSVAEALTEKGAVPFAVQSLVIALSQRMEVKYVPPLLVWRGLGLIDSDEALTQLVGRAVEESSSYQEIFNSVISRLRSAGAQEPNTLRFIHDMGSQLETIRRLHAL